MHHGRLYLLAVCNEGKNNFRYVSFFHFRTPLSLLCFGRPFLRFSRGDLKLIKIDYTRAILGRRAKQIRRSRRLSLSLGRLRNVYRERMLAKSRLERFAFTSATI